MGRFFERHPEVTVNFTTRLPGVFDFRRENLDVAIQVGEPAWPGVMLHRLTSDEIVAVASPSLVASLALREPKDVRRATLIVHRSRPDTWSHWFAMHGLGTIGAQPSIAFEQFTMVFQAAIAGLGFAIAPEFLARPELVAGELVTLFDPIVQKGQGDFFAYPSRRRISHRSPPSATGSWRKPRRRGAANFRR
jgi:LysR family glycine cleavage system transcriptional activator